VIRCCHPLFITGCIRTLPLIFFIVSIFGVAIPYSSRVAFGLLIICLLIIIFLVAIPYSSRVAFGLVSILLLYALDACCHPLFITGCIRTRRYIHGHAKRRIVAIPYSSRVAFGHSKGIPLVYPFGGCHPLFITGCIRTTTHQEYNHIRL